MSSTAPHQAIYRRWRAQTFGQIVGQGPVVETLRNAVRSGRSAHAYLFVGPRGTGKTSMARILAKALNCPNLRDGEPCDECPACVAIREGRALDVSEMDAASNNRVDDIRDLLPRIYTAPSDLTSKVFIIDEVQRITQGWDVLLKTLEEPPEHVVFIFCTTDSSQIRPAVLSRVQRFDFRKLTVAEIGGKLATILQADGRTADADAIDLIARLAAGGMRDAESMLDQLLSSHAERLTADRVREVLGLVDEETVDAFIAALVNGDAVAGIDLLDALEERGRDLRAFTEQGIERLRSALVASLGRGQQTGIAAVGPARLAAATRRLAEIDPAHLGPGGLRLQLELALLAPIEASAAVPASVASAPASPPATAPTAHLPDSDRVTAASPTPTPPEPPSQHDPAAARDHAPDHGAPRGERPRPPDRAASPARAASPDRAASVPPPHAEPAAAARPSSAPVAAASGSSASLQTILERWPEIVAIVSRHPPTKPLIEACRPISVDGSVVTLGFPETQSFFKDVAERRRNILEEGVGKVLGMPVTVRCVATNLEIAPLPEDADSTRLMSEFRRIYGDDVIDVGEVR